MRMSTPGSVAIKQLGACDGQRWFGSDVIDMDEPVSRQHERDYYRHYGYPNYWGESGIWGMGAYPGLLAADRWSDVPAEPADAP